MGHWISEVEALGDGQRCLVGIAKLDEHIEKPLSSFIQIFQSLLDRVLTDPKEDAKDWNKKIRDVLGHPFSVFHFSALAMKLIFSSAQGPLGALEWIRNRQIKEVQKLTHIHPETIRTLL